MDKEARKEYRKKWMANKRKPVHMEVCEQPIVVNKPGTQFVNKINWCNDIPLSLFEGHGRGVPVKGYVLIARSSPSMVKGEWTDGEQGIVKTKDWIARLARACAHSPPGWSCKPCIA